MLYYVYVTVDLGIYFSPGKRYFELDVIPLRADTRLLLSTHERQDGIIEVCSLHRQTRRRRRHSGLGKPS